MIIEFETHNPKIAENVFVAPSSWVIGNVSIEENCSIFFGAVLRGDILPISIGKGTNIQEHSMIHTTHGRSPTFIGEQVTVGHRAIVHGASVGNRCLIGMGSIILDEASIGDESIVAAGTIVTEGKTFPPRSMIMGTPGKVVREITDEDLANILRGTNSYVKLAAKYRGIFNTK
jgi:carbonic anhydrase/acetyltransferase-like protein (isoleucine patch superfamily)